MQLKTCFQNFLYSYIPRIPTSFLPLLLVFKAFLNVFVIHKNILKLKQTTKIYFPQFKNTHNFNVNLYLLLSLYYNFCTSVKQKTNSLYTDTQKNLASIMDQRYCIVLHNYLNIFKTNLNKYFFFNEGINFRMLVIN